VTEKVEKQVTELLLLSQSLYRRKSTAQVVPYRHVNDGYLETFCHKNAADYASKNSGWKVVHGWLIFDYEADTQGLLKFVQFNPHSIVENQGGERLDVTPSQASRRYPFLDHVGTPLDFARIVEGNWISVIEYDPRNDFCRAISPQKSPD
jgi:hypothetical protein